jgi:translation initiation factor 2 beta subunit (eIF-2beta)/eIF-5
VAKWLYEIKPEINISAYEDYAFRFACERGHLNVTKWLYEIKPEINISAENDYAFRSACANGHLNVAQWLYEIKPDINMSADNDWAFKNACKRGHLNMVQWLCNLLQLRYHVEISNNCIINWHIKQIIPINESKKIYTEEMCLCPICNDSKSNIQTNCIHSYCLACITEWYNRSLECPMCRQQITDIYNLINIQEFIVC